MMRQRRAKRLTRTSTTAIGLGVLVLLGVIFGGVEDSEDVSSQAENRPPQSSSQTTTGDGSTALAAPQYTVTASSLRLRAAPSASGAILGGAPRGTAVSALGPREGAWITVRLPNGIQGWMHSAYLDPVSEQAAVEAAGRTRSAVSHSSRAPAAGIELADLINGRPTITDGDTIRIGNQRIRLEGIDAPESGQRCEDGQGRSYPCGGRSANALADLIARRSVACRNGGADDYDRVLGTCWVVTDLGSSRVAPRTGGEGSLNAMMVSKGWALAFRRYSSAYVSEERTAEQANRGLWQGRFVKPWDYRGGARLTQQVEAGSAPAPAPAAAVACNIKGNISDNGRIYHLPGSRWYARTKINTGRGERLFCSVDEAKAAGWRAPRR